MKELSDAEFYAEIMAEERELDAQVQRHNTRLLQVIRRVKGEAFYQELLFIIEYNEVLHDYYRIVRKPKGAYQKENFTTIPGYWVDQWSVGDSGDSFCGYLSIKLKPGRWLELYYAC